MKPVLPMLVLLLALGASAQDLEPTADRAIASLVRELVTELPYRVSNGDALALTSDAAADRGLVDKLAAKLLAEGFRLQAGPAHASGAIPLHVSTNDAGKLGVVRVSTGDWVVERRFGRASWVDRARDAGAIVVAGVRSDSADASLESARARLDAELRRRYPALARTADLARYSSRQPAATFVAQRTVAGRKEYEAYILAEPSFKRLDRAEREILEAELRTPWIKGGALAAAGCLLWLAYLRADFRTRGFRTRRLRLLFGTLFAALSLGLWSLPL
jgi:hypothetical protein